MSKTEVPSKLSNLWERYKLEQERAGKSVHKNSGFAGTGFKFDEAEKQMDKDRKNMQKAALGLAVSFLDFFLQFIELSRTLTMKMSPMLILTSKLNRFSTRRKVSKKQWSELKKEQTVSYRK